MLLHSGAIWCVIVVLFRAGSGFGQSCGPQIDGQTFLNIYRGFFYTELEIDALNSNLTSPGKAPAVSRKKRGVSWENDPWYSIVTECKTDESESLDACCTTCFKWNRLDYAFTPDGYYSVMYPVELAGVYFQALNTARCTKKVCNNDKDCVLDNPVPFRVLATRYPSMAYLQLNQTVNLNFFDTVLYRPPSRCICAGPGVSRSAARSPRSHLPILTVFMIPYLIQLLK